MDTPTDTRVTPGARFKGRRALVLGGTGFIGQALVKRLLECGAHVTYTSTHPKHALQLDGDDDRGRMAAVDLRDRAGLLDALRQKEFLFNFAGVSGAAYSNQHPFADLDVNGRGILSVLDVCREANPSVRIVFPGTRLQYGVPEYLPVDEAHPMRPRSIYGIHKLLGEKYHLMYHDVYGLRATVLRISNPYGLGLQRPGAASYNVASQFIRAALQDRPLRVFGDGRQLRDYIHIDDVVEAVLRVALDETTVGQSYNLGIGSPVKLIEMAERIAAVVGRGHVECVDWPAAFSQVETGDFYFSIEKLAQKIGWRPQIQLDEGIRRSVFAVHGALSSSQGRAS